MTDEQQAQIDAILVFKREVQEGPEGSCIACGAIEGVELESSRTMHYVPLRRVSRYERLKLDDPFFDDPPAPPDPNAPIRLCRECAEEHHSNWDECWAAFYAGLL